MYVFGHLILRDLRNLAGRPINILYQTLFPFGLVALIGLLNEGFFEEGRLAWDLAAVNMLLYAALNVSLLASSLLLDSNFKAANYRVLLAPLHRGLLYGSKIIACLLFSLGGLGCGVLIGASVFGLNLGPWHGCGFFLILAMVILAATALGVTSAKLMGNETRSHILLSLVVNLSALVGGTFFPLSVFGDAVGRFTRFSPVYWINHASFALIYNGEIAVLYKLVVAALGIVAGCLLVCLSRLRPELG